jgi:hypothetical protein
MTAFVKEEKNNGVLAWTSAVLSSSPLLPSREKPLLFPPSLMQCLLTLSKLARVVLSNSIYI